MTIWITSITEWMINWLRIISLDLTPRMKRKSISFDEIEGEALPVIHTRSWVPSLCSVTSERAVRATLKKKITLAKDSIRDDSLDVFAHERTMPGTMKCVNVYSISCASLGRYPNWGMRLELDWLKRSNNDILWATIDSHDPMSSGQDWIPHRDFWIFEWTLRQSNRPSVDLFNSSSR